MRGQSSIILLCIIVSSIASPLCFSFGNDITTFRDIAYGEHALQAFDVYSPKHAHNAPVIFMVHGGAWKTGDKSSRAVVKHKVKRWVNNGFIFISVNYRLLPDTPVLSQYGDIVSALQFAQKNAASWGGSASQFILMGHSAGAHLVSLLSASQHNTSSSPSLDWLGTIAIDSAVYDVTTLMRSNRVKRIYTRAFGQQPRYWSAVSPYDFLKQKIPPFLAIYSSQRKDNARSQVTSFIEKAQGYGAQAQTLAVDLSHRGTNAALGKNNAYTHSVEAFMRTLSPQVAARLP